MGIFSLLESTVKLAGNVVDVAVAPVELVVDLTNEAVEPVAELSNDLVEEFKEDK